jgi:hypothetical protein
MFAAAALRPLFFSLRRRDETPRRETPELNATVSQAEASHQA